MNPVSTKSNTALRAKTDDGFAIDWMTCNVIPRGSFIDMLTIDVSRDLDRGER
jgi:hypothetical protein